jgi:hypothetical protein
MPVFHTTTPIRTPIATHTTVPELGTNPRLATDIPRALRR